MSKMNFMQWSLRILVLPIRGAAQTSVFHTQGTTFPACVLMDRENFRSTKCAKVKIKYYSSKLFNRIVFMLFFSYNDTF